MSSDERAERSFRAARNRARALRKSQNQAVYFEGARAAEEGKTVHACPQVYFGSTLAGHWRLGFSDASERIARAEKEARRAQQAEGGLLAAAERMVEERLRTKSALESLQEQVEKLTKEVEALKRSKR